jgi:hypothetical protein
VHQRQASAPFLEHARMAGDLGFVPARKSADAVMNREVQPGAVV